MKYCKRPYEYFYLDDYKGDVALCPWMKWECVNIGNLNENEALEIWHGEKAENLREKFRKGDFSACRLEACPFLQNDKLPEVDENYAASRKAEDSPVIVNMAFDFMCNQYCETCRPCKFRPFLPKYRNYMERIHKQIMPFLENAGEITASGHGDPFASPYMMNILGNLHPKKQVKILLETNGVYLDQKHWRKLRHLEEHYIELAVTVNSFNEFVYKHINRGGNLARLLVNLDFMRQLRKSGKINFFAMCFVIQDRNFREMPEFIERCLAEYKADRVVLKPVYQWGTMPEDVYWFKDVLNPMHPYHGEYLEMLDMPIMNDPRVFNFGGRTAHEARPFPGHASGKKTA